MARFDGPTSKKLRDALQKAFLPNDFDIMLKDQLDIDRHNLSLATRYVDILFDVIEHFNHQFTTEVLVQKAVLTVPKSPELQDFQAKYLQQGAQLPDAAPTTEALQRAITELGYLDPIPFRTRMAAMESRVCRVEMPDGGSGSGFLVAPDLVMTNYHVVERLVDKPDKIGLIRLRFDYTLLGEGAAVPEGTLYNAAKLEAYSPYSSMDLVDPPEHDAEPDKLDFALLRVDGRPGEEKVGGEANQSRNALLRGWVEQPDLPPELKPGTPLVILQHPDGKPLKLALDTKGVLKENDAKTRVRYQVNTEKGSSGSPCFDIRWNLAALHHAGDPNFRRLALFNQGIPFPAILAFLGGNPATAHLKNELLQKVPAAEQ